MSTTMFQGGQQDTRPGVTTRSRKRLRDEADPSSTAPDPDNRKKIKSQSTPAALRRSSRHAAIATSRADIENPATRHPQEMELETPSTSRSTSLVDDESEPVSLPIPSIPPSRQRAYATRRNDSKTEEYISSGAHTESPSTPNVEIIDLTERSQKRSRDEDGTDGGDDEPVDEAPHRITRSAAKKARLLGSADAKNAVHSPSARRHATARKTSRSEAQAPPTTKGALTPHQPTPGISETNSDDEGDATGEGQMPPAAEPRYFVPSMRGPSSPSDPPYATPTPTDPPSVMESIRACTESTQSAKSVLSPVEPSMTQESVGRHTDGGENIPEAAPASDALYEAKIGLASYTFQDAEEFDNGAGRTLEESDTGSAYSQLEAAAPILLAEPDSACIQESIFQLQTEPLALESVACPSTWDGSMDGLPSASGRPRSPSCAYLGVDVRFLRFRNPPTSYLAPNPVRRAPRNPAVRRDKFRYLLHATEKAGLLAFAQTRRQFPRWMPRPSRNYFVGSRFIPHGEPALEEDMDMEEVSVGMHLDGAFASTSVARDVFLLPQTELYPSESSYTTPHMELDPELDPTSLLNDQSMFYAPQNTTTDFLGAGPGPSSAQYSASSSGQYTQQDQQCSQEQLWPFPTMSNRMHGPRMTGQGPFLAGPSNTQAPAFESSGSGSLVASAGMQPYAQDLPWDPSGWVNSPQFALFGVPPLPAALPVQNMSMDSSLSAMATYFHNDSHKGVDLDLVDGISATHSHGQGVPHVQVQTQFGHSSIQQLDSHGTDDADLPPSVN